MRIRYRDMQAYKYQLAETYQLEIEIRPPVALHSEYVDLNEKGVLTIYRGYAWDGPSGPTFDTRDFMRASLVHDALYQLIRMGLLARAFRDEADNLLRFLCLQDGMPMVRASWVHAAVRAMGNLSCEPRKGDIIEILEAP